MPEQCRISTTANRAVYAGNFEAGPAAAALPGAYTHPHPRSPVKQRPSPLTGQQAREHVRYRADNPVRDSPAESGSGAQTPLAVQVPAEVAVRHRRMVI